jgi:tetratricopeptide (TPR) repeat protein
LLNPIYEKTTEEYILEGNQYYQKYKFEKAIEAYEKAIEIKPDFDEAYNRKPIAQFLQNWFFVFF